MTTYYQQPAYLAPETRARSVDINTLNDAVKAAFDAIPAADQTWAGIQDYSGASLRARLPVLGGEVATKGYVDAQKLAGSGMALPPTGVYTLYSVEGAFIPKLAGPMYDAASLAQSLAIQLST